MSVVCRVGTSLDAFNISHFSVAVRHFFQICMRSLFGFSLGLCAINMSVAAPVSIQLKADAHLAAAVGMFNQPHPEIIRLNPGCGAQCIGPERLFMWPVQGEYRISSKFGKRHHPLRKKVAWHRGVDIAAPKGTPILSPSQGEVRFAGWKKGYGRTVDIDHGQGWMSRYAHASHILVRKGEQVSPGQLIAKVGQSGAATGDHLHFEIWKNGQPLNPMSFYPDAAALPDRRF